MAKRNLPFSGRKEPMLNPVPLLHFDSCSGWCRLMLRSLLRYLPTGENRRNACAALLVLFTFGFYHWNTDPEACGGDPVASPRRHNQLLMVSIATPLPKPVVAPQDILHAVEEKPASDSSTVTTTPSASPDLPPANEIQSPEGTVLTGRWALTASQERLRRGQEVLEKTSDYSAQFRRQERINGELLDAQAMNLKVRHAPFSLYMKWTEGDKGRQLIFAEGQNEDKVLIQIGGVAGRLTGALAMDPDDPRVRAESRYPATCAGLLALTKIILSHHENDLQRATGITSEMRDGESFDNRPCFLTTLVYDSPSINADYYKSLILIDKELSVPVCVRNYTWVEGQAPAKEDEDSLIEHYSYTGLEINIQLTDNDFGKSKYKMR